MPIALVHGVPETRALWRPLVEALAARGVQEVTLLSPPGFGAPTPDGWDPTHGAYRGWLIGELERLGGGVDLVGHDWGAGHVGGVIAERPDLLRSWTIDCAGLFHPSYVWHDMAQAWQTPKVGEQVIAGLVDADLAARTEMAPGFGAPGDIAADMAAGQDVEMARCILGLYRSAAQPAMRELGERQAKAERRPGLVLIPTDDPYAGPPETAEEVAATLGAEALRLEGQGHWWMFGAAATVADALVTHWQKAGER